MSLRLKSFGFYIRLWHYMLPLVAFAAAGFVRFVAMAPMRSAVGFDPWFYFAVLLFITLVWAIFVEQQRLCDTDELFRENTGIRKSLMACLATYTVLLAMLFFYRQQNVSRVFFVVSSLALLVLTVGTRVVLRRVLRISRRGRRSIRVLMVGTSHRAGRIASRLSRVPLITSEVVAYLRIGDETVEVHDAPVFQFFDIGLGRVPGFEEIVIAASPEQLTEMDDLLTRIGMLCVPTRVVLDLGSLPVVRDRLFQLGDLQMLDLASTPLESPAYFFLKRVFDVAFSLTLLLFLAPVLALIAIAIRLSSEGPVFFRQERVGLNGGSFQMYKFLTMRIAATSESDSCWTI